NFANASKIQSILTFELLAEAKRNLCIHLMSKYSMEAFVELMNENRIEPSLVFTNNNVNKELKLIVDVNFVKLRKELSKDKSGTQKFYASISLNEVTNAYDDYIMPNIGNSKKKPMDLYGCLTTGETKRRISQSEEYRSYFDEKLKEYS